MERVGISDLLDEPVTGSGGYIPAIEAVSDKYSGDVEGLRRLNLGCGRDVLPGWVNLDMAETLGVDVVFNVEAISSGFRLPFGDDSFYEVVGSHFIEHIRGVLPLMAELHRVSAPGAVCRFLCPYGSSDDAFEDPTHVRVFFENSFGYFSQPFYWRADYGYRGDWQPELVVLKVLKEFCGGTPAQTMLTVRRLRNVVTEMEVVLRCVKPIRGPLKALQAAPELRIQPVTV